MLTDNGSAMSSLDAIIYSNHKKSIERNISWAFIGSRGHSDRVKELDVFHSWSPNLVDEGYTPVEMRAIYNSSLFVLVGRGNKNLDCFRIYEAMISGAIPIVVGSEDELAWVFQYEGHRLPLLYANSPQDALAKCKSMNHSQIDQQRDELTHWYIRRLHHIRNKVKEVFHNESMGIAGI
jgi:hypothetical protein